MQTFTLPTLWYNAEWGIITIQQCVAAPFLSLYSNSNTLYIILAGRIMPNPVICINPRDHRSPPAERRQQAAVVEWSTLEVEAAGDIHHTQPPPRNCNQPPCHPSRYMRPARALAVVHKALPPLGQLHRQRAPPALPRTSHTAIFARRVSRYCPPGPSTSPRRPLVAHRANSAFRSTSSIRNSNRCMYSTSLSPVPSRR